MDDEIARLVNDLARPIFNYRMASGLLSLGKQPDTPRSRGAELKRASAEDEIDRAVRDYAHRTGLI